MTNIFLTDLFTLSKRNKISSVSSEDESHCKEDTINDAINVKFTGEYFNIFRASAKTQPLVLQIKSLKNQSKQ